MALMLIMVARIAVYILLRISGKSKSPITPIVPNPTLMIRRIKITASTVGLLILPHLSWTVIERLFLRNRLQEVQLTHPVRTGFPRRALSAIAAPAAIVIAAITAMSWSSRVGRGWIRRIAQIDRKIRQRDCKKPGVYSVLQ